MREVPLMYGQEVRFFEPLPVATVADLYLRLAEEPDAVRYPGRQG